MVRSFLIEGPKQLTIAFLPEGSLLPGSRDNEDHVIIVFKPPESEGGSEDIAVDMARVQYGPNGRGMFGEPYFLDRSPTGNNR